MTENEFVKRWKKLDLKYIDDILKESKKLVLSRFDKQQDVDGKPKFNNAPLQPSTEKDRKRNNFPQSEPILKRTGKLRNSIQFTNNGAGKIKISSDLKYAKDLNDGTHSGKWGKSIFTPNMKPRKFLEFPKEVSTVSSSIRKKLLKKLDQDKTALYKLYMSGKK
tara:strand:- start:371 stop:862 length:492 start_codon:yes stop_codon:yes gene_type:complete